MIIVLFLLAFLIRLISLNQSLWLDEATTAKVVSHFSFIDIVTRFSPHDFHPPGFYILEKMWTSLFGYSEIALRFPSVLFSLLTGYLIFQIVKIIANEKSARVAAAFFLFNPLIVYYSQEARMYMMVTFFLTVALYYFVKLLRKYHISDIFFFNIFIFLSFFTFYGSVFFILSLYIYTLVTRKFKLLPYLLPGFLTALVLLLPLLYVQLNNARESLSLVTNWKAVLGTANLKNTLLIPIKFTLGRVSFHPKALYYFVAGIWTVFVFYSFMNSRQARILFFERSKTKLRSGVFFFLFFTPLFLGFLFSLITPLLQYFRFLYLIPILCILLALNTRQAWQKQMVLLGFIVLSLMSLINPQFHREDWKALAKSLPQNAPVYMILPSSDPLLYYKKGQYLFELRSLRVTAKNKNTIIIIPYTAEIYNFSYKNELLKFGFTKQKEYSFREVTYEVWIKSYAMTEVFYTQKPLQ